MNNIQKRFLLFLIGCIGLRSYLVYIATRYSDNAKIQNILTIITLLISIGFFTIYFTGIRKVGQETLGSEIWWNELRPVHGMLYLLFAVFSYQQKSFAWLFLLLDVIIGLLSFLIFHYNEGNFEKLIN